MEERFADYLSNKYFIKDMTLVEALEYVKTTIENVVKDRYYNQEAFVVEITDIRKPMSSRTNASHAVVTINLPKSINYTRETFNTWFKDNGFVWNEMNYQMGWRIVV